MARVMDIIANPTEVWEFKDRIGLVNRDPNQMHKSLFVQFLQVKAAQVHTQLSTYQLSADEINQKTAAVMAQIVSDWKRAAKERNDLRAKAAQTITH